MKCFEEIFKMNNPSIILSTAFNMTDDEWKLIFNTAKILAQKLENKIKIPLIVTLQDLLDNPHTCTSKEHELIEFKNDKSYYICVHCLQKFKKADLTDQTKEHFFSKIKEENEKK